MGMANPLTGVGYGNFRKTWRKYFGSKEQELTQDLTDGNHNTYLGLFADTGFPGLVLFVMLFGYLLTECFQSRRLLDSGDHFEKNFALSSAGLVVVAMIEAMSGDLRFDPTLNTVMCLFVGITASMKLRAVSMKRSKQKVPTGRDVFN